MEKPTPTQQRRMRAWIKGIKRIHPDCFVLNIYHSGEEVKLDEPFEGKTCPVGALPAIFPTLIERVGIQIELRKHVHYNNPFTTASKFFGLWTNRFPLTSTENDLYGGKPVELAEEIERIYNEYLKSYEKTP